MILDLKSLLSSSDFTRKDKILFILFATNKELKVKDILEVAVDNGLREAKKWNISQSLINLSGYAVKLPDGWSITEKGKDYLKELDVIEKRPSHTFKSELRKHTTAIKNQFIKEFAEEAVAALEYGLLRSAVVLSWVGAVSILYNEVVKNHLSEFNSEAETRFPKWKPAMNEDDLSKMKEYDFLQILNALSVICKNTKGELENCLKFRNSCGHPNTLKIGEHKVAAHIEILLLNVYSKYTV